MTTQTRLLKVSEGKSMIFLIPGTLLIALAIAFFYFIPLISVVLVAAAIVLFLAETGLEIDLENNRFRKFKNVIGIETATWETLPETGEFHLQIAVESKTVRGFMGPSPVGGWNNDSVSKSITYDLSYVDHRAKKKIIYEFQDYDIAKKMLKQLRNLEKFEVIDHIAIKLQENREKRMNRR